MPFLCDYCTLQLLSSRHWKIRPVFEMLMILNRCKFLYIKMLWYFKIIRTTHCSYCSNGLLNNIPCISIWFLPLARYSSSQSGDSCKGQNAWRYARKHNKSQHPASYESNDKATNEACHKLYVLPYLNMRSQILVLYRGAFPCVLNMKDPLLDTIHILSFFFCQTHNDLLPSLRGHLGWVQCLQTFLKLLPQLSSLRQRMQCLAWEQLQGITIAAVLTAFLQPLSNMTPLEQVKCFSQSFWIGLIQLNRDLSVSYSAATGSFSTWFKL